MFTNRPLYANAADVKLNVLRPEQEQFEAALRRGRNTLLIGEAGTGKTTTLHLLEFRLRQERRACFVSLAQAREVAHATAALHRAAHEAGWVPDLDQALIDRALVGDDPFAPTYLVRSLADVPSGAVFLVDDVESSVGHALFGRLRDELWQLSCVWGVAISTDQAAGLVQPPADAFFDERIRLSPLTESERRTLLRLRSDADPKRAEPWAEVDAIASDGPDNPRRLLAYARDVLERRVDPRDLTAAAQRRRERAERVGGRAGTMLVSELESLGPVSASDEELLKRLGWTRPRAAEMLHRLEKSGIVHSYSDHRGGPGRPRKIYELRRPDEIGEQP